MGAVRRTVRGDFCLIVALGLDQERWSYREGREKVSTPGIAPTGLPPVKNTNGAGKW